MGTAKKCYICMTEADEEAKACPRCGAKLGARQESGVAKKPGSPLLAIFLTAAALTVTAALATRAKSEPADPEASSLQVITGLGNPKDGAVEAIKKKGAASFSAVGVANVGYKGDTLCLYVDKRFANLSTDQQKQVLSIVAGEWNKALGKDSTALNILEAGTEKILAELVI